MPTWKWDSAFNSAFAAYSNSDLTAAITGTAGVSRNIRTTQTAADSTGLLYWEISVDALSGTNNQQFGIVEGSFAVTDNVPLLTSNAHAGMAGATYYSSQGGGAAVVSVATGQTPVAAGGVVRFLFDTGLRKLSMAMNGSAFYTGPTLPAGKFWYVHSAQSSGNATHTLRARGGFSYPMPVGAVPLGGAATLAGIALLGNGSPASKIIVLDTTAKLFQEVVFPAVDGTYAVDLPTGSYFVTAVGPAGYRPETHGPIVVA